MRTLTILVRGGIAIAAFFILIGSAGAQEAAGASADPKITFDGEVALWTVAIKPDKAADFEQIVRRLREALLKANTTESQRQLSGWKVVRLSQPLPDGNVPYLHVVDPVVPGADYSVMHALYAAFPEERSALYELYRGAFARNLSLATGKVAVDLSQTPTVAQTPAQ